MWPYGRGSGRLTRSPESRIFRNRPSKGHEEGGVGIVKTHERDSVVSYTIVFCRCKRKCSEWCDTHSSVIEI